MSQIELDQSQAPQLAHLLSIDPSARENWRPEELAAILRHQLQTPIELDLSGDQTPPPGGQTFEQLLASPQPSLEALERVKRFVKACKSHPDTPLPGEVATLLYFACIAVAQLRCGTRISSLKNSDLLEGFRWALALEWMPPLLRQLFAEGATSAGFIKED